jgi:GNAT superfamily N-acetyltransferase
MLNFSLRAGTEADLPAIHALVHELAIFEKAPEAHTATVEDYITDFRANIFQTVVAELEDGTIAGMIFFHFAYSTWRGRMMYLEDFVVSADYRSHGIGEVLFKSFLQTAQANDCKLVKWQVLDWNTDAIRFYERYGATIEKEWYNGKIIFL